MPTTSPIDASSDTSLDVLSVSTIEEISYSILTSIFECSVLSLPIGDY